MGGIRPMHLIVGAVAVWFLFGGGAQSCGTVGSAGGYSHSGGHHSHHHHGED